MRHSLKLAEILALFAMMQLYIIMHATNTVSLIDSSDNDWFFMPHLNNGTARDCFPPRTRNSTEHHNSNANSTIIYLETAYVDLHYETFYSFIHEICSCDKEKDPHWKISTESIPYFYVGPSEMLTISFEKILQEYNDTTCGPIFYGKPEDPSLTIVTTSYPDDFQHSHPHQYHKLINDTRYIFICHEDGPLLESATNIFFLTPRHNRYIVPSYFPPTIVKRNNKSIRQLHPEKPPIFLVLGSFKNKYKRNVDSLVYPLSGYRNKNFTVRFLGGSSTSVSNDALTQMLRAKFPKDYNKVELLPRTDTYEFMMRVAEADVILPLVDSGSFYHYRNGYQGGKKLTSSVMWGLGFAKKMLIYRPLAEVFGIQEDNRTYFLHGDATATLPAFYEAFGRCLDYVLENR